MQLVAFARNIASWFFAFIYHTLSACQSKNWTIWTAILTEFGKTQKRSRWDILKYRISMHPPPPKLTVGSWYLPGCAPSQNQSSNHPTFLCAQTAAPYLGSESKPFARFALMKNCRKILENARGLQVESKLVGGFNLKHMLVKLGNISPGIGVFK